MATFVLALVATGIAWLFIKGAEATAAGFREGRSLHRADDHPSWSPRRKRWNERWHAAGYAAHQMKTGMPDARHALVTGWQRSGQQRAAQRAEFDARSNRATDRATAHADRATVPGRTVPPTEPTTRGTVAPARATEPRPATPPNHATATEPSHRATPPKPESVGKKTVDDFTAEELLTTPQGRLALKEKNLQDMKDGFAKLRANGFFISPEDEAEHNATRERLESEIQQLRREMGVGESGDVTPINKYQGGRPTGSASTVRPASQPSYATTTGGNMSMPTGEVTNYDGHIAQYDRLIQVYQNRVEAAEQAIKELTGASAALDNLDAGSRDVHMDSKHLGFIASQMEVNNADLESAKAARASANENLQTALAMRKDLQDRAGQVNQVTQATGHAADARYHQPI